MNRRIRIPTGAAVLAAAALLAGCHRDAPAAAVAASAPVVGVAPVVRKTLQHRITLSSELVPYQEIDVYAKESGYVRELLVDYGSRVKAGQLLAVLEIPELEAQLQQDKAEIDGATTQVARVGDEVESFQAQAGALQKEYDRLGQVASRQPGLVAPQEVDDAQAHALAAQAQVDAAKAALGTAQNQLVEVQAHLARDNALYNYARITAPFDGTVTQRYANLGALMQAGTSSSTQAMPLVRLSQTNRYRLVIPVPEAYVADIHPGDPVQVSVGALGRTFPGRVARTSMDVQESTRTMRAEVDVPNADGSLLPGMYADANIMLEQRPDAVTVPVAALDNAGTNPSVDVVSDGRIQLRSVQVGLQTSNDAEILSGLRPGEQVVVSDRTTLQTGEAVQPHAVQPVQTPE